MKWIEVLDILSFPAHISYMSLPILICVASGRITSENTENLNFVFTRLQVYGFRLLEMYIKSVLHVAQELQQLFI